MVKEKGYDEFLAEKICLGREQIARGEFVTKIQINAEMAELFVKLAQEQAKQDAEEFVVGAVYG